MPIYCLIWALVCLWWALSLNDDTQSLQGGCCCCCLVDCSPATAAVCLFIRRHWEVTSQGRTDVRWAYAAPTSHCSVLFWHNTCQKTFAFLSSLPHQVALCCFFKSAFVALQMLPQRIDQIPSARAPVTKKRLRSPAGDRWRPGEDGNQPPARSETHPRCGALIFLGEKNIICSDIWCLWQVAVVTATQAHHWRNERRAGLSILITLYCHLIV